MSYSRFFYEKCDRKTLLFTPKMVTFWNHGIRLAVNYVIHDSEDKNYEQNILQRNNKCK